MSFPCAFNNNHLLSTSISARSSTQTLYVLSSQNALINPHGGIIFFFSPHHENWGLEKVQYLPQGLTDRNLWSQSLTWAPELFSHFTILCHLLFSTFKIKCNQWRSNVYERHSHCIILPSPAIGSSLYLLANIFENRLFLLSTDSPPFIPGLAPSIQWKLSGFSSFVSLEDTSFALNKLAFFLVMFSLLVLIILKPVRHPLSPLFLSCLQPFPQTTTHWNLRNPRDFS